MKYKVAFINIWQNFSPSLMKIHEALICHVYNTVINVKYCEIIINRGVLFFADFVVHLALKPRKKKIQRNAIFLFIVGYNV
jgi:hypothetical protein